MSDITGFKVDDIVDGKVKDKVGHRAPEDVVNKLRQSGIVHIRLGGEIDWAMIGKDAQSLLELQGLSEG